MLPPPKIGPTTATLSPHNSGKLWIVRINAACRMRGLRYSEFIHGLQRAFIALDRKSLSEIAIHDPETFDKLVEIAKKNLCPALAAQHKS